MKDPELDCLYIGYNEIPFERYESFLRSYGEEIEAYRDLKFNFETGLHGSAESHFRAREIRPP